MFHSIPFHENKITLNSYSIAMNTCDLSMPFMLVLLFWTKVSFPSPPWVSQPHFEASVKMRLTLSKVGIWSPLGLPQLQSSTAKGKTPLLEVSFILLEMPWSVDVENGLAWAIWTSVAQVIVERRVVSQTGSLTPNHKKSRIDPIPMCEDGVRHTIGKLLRRATSLLETSSRSEVWAGSYELPKSQESQLGQFWDSFVGVPGIKVIWMRVSWSNAENTIWGKAVVSLESGSWWVKWV